jgi:hypothetical protein
MNRFLKHWRCTGRGEAYRAHVISYADDFVILSRGHAGEALAWTRMVMNKLGLALNETKTVVRDARHERFDFLGYSFGPHHYRKDGHWYLGASASKKSVLRLKAKVSDILVPGNTGAWPEVRGRLNGCRKVGARTSATAPGCRCTERSITTSTSRSVDSWSDVTRCRRAAPASSHERQCSARLG